MTKARFDRVLLVGFMGAGKSSVGKMLADELGWPDAEKINATDKRKTPENCLRNVVYDNMCLGFVW